MFFKRFGNKLKIAAFRELIIICAISFILVILALTIHWTEAVANFLYKFQDYPADDLVISLSVVAILLMIYCMRRNREKRKIINKLLETDAGLQKAHANLQMVLANSSSIIFNVEADRGWKLLYMSENVTPILGYSKEEYSIPGWWVNNVHSEDLPLALAETEKLFTINSNSFNYRFKHKQGHWVWMHSESKLLSDASGNPLEIAGTWRDISEQINTAETIRRNNERFSHAFKATKDIVYDWNIKTKELWMSDETHRSFGYDRETTKLSFDWWKDRVHPEDCSLVRSSMVELLTNKGHNWSAEYRFRRADNSYANILSRGYVIYGADNTPLRLVGAMSDMTLLKQAESELRDAKEKAEESVRFRTEFLANMSHEIRTPINGVIGMTELALETDTNSQQRRYLENIRSSSETLLNLVNDILDFSKIDAGKFDLWPVNFSLRDEIPKALQSLTLKASAKKLEFVFSLDQNVPDLYFADVFRLQQVIVNLAGNAIKFTERGEVAVKCKLKSADRDKAILEFSVSDTGVGIDPSRLSAIFNKFTQADVSTSRQYGGTGLGLSISKSLVEMMDGKIWAESEEGKGSTFYFTICMKLQDEKSKPRFVQNASINGKKVLVVEDNKSARKHNLQLVNQFKMRGFGVATGEDALLELNKAAEQKGPYSLVLLDISLAGQMDGYDVALEMQKDILLKDTPIIVISMSQKASDRERFGRIGITNFFSKPFSQSDLLDTIQNLLVPSNPHFIRQNSLANEIKAEALACSESLKFLLVEDNLINQEVGFNMLTKRGHSVTIANNGQEAVESIQSENFHIVLMDVEMPKMNGYEATQKIREIEKISGNRTHIIGLTANAMTGDRERCLENGMDDYLSKPLGFPDMCKAINRFMQASETDMQDNEELKEDDTPVVNLDALFNRLDRDEEIFEQFLDKVPQHISASLEKFLEAVKDKNREDIASTAHSLRGLCLNLEMRKITDIALKIELLAKENKLNDLVPLVQPLENELQKALHYIEERKRLVLEEV